MNSVPQEKSIPISFQDAIALTQSLMNQMLTKAIDSQDLEQVITTLVNTKNGARGFFVAYLTSELNLADNPSKEVINALKSSPEVVSELLVKNLAMSIATAITHHRHRDEENALGSERVCQRTVKLIKLLNLDVINKELRKLELTITQKEDFYQAFIQRWNYDQEQQIAIQKTISNLDIND